MNCNFPLPVRRLMLLALSILFLGITPQETTAQDLDDFYDCSRAKGVDVIPFSSLYSKAKSVAREVDKWKYETKKWGPPTWEKKKMDKLKEKEALEAKLEKKVDEIEDLKKRYSEVDVSYQEKERDAIQDDLDEVNDDIEDINEDLEDGAEAWKRLWNARGGLREIFDDVKDELDDAEDDPEDYLGSSPSDDDIKKLLGYIKTIKGKVEDEEEGHEIAEKQAKTAEQKLRTLLEKNSYR